MFLAIRKDTKTMNNQRYESCYYNFLVLFIYNKKVQFSKGKILGVTKFVLMLSSISLENKPDIFIIKVI